MSGESLGSLGIAPGVELGGVLDGKYRIERVLYISPEQLQSARSVDQRTDIWSVGVILYELIAGRGPFVGESYSQLCIEIATATPPSILGCREDVPPLLEPVILKCLRKDRNERYANLAELAQALAPFATQRAAISVERIARIVGIAGALPSGAAPLTPLGAPSEQRMVPETSASWGQTASPVKSRQGLVLVLGGVVALGLLGFIVMRGLRESRIEEVPTAGGAAEPVSNLTPPPRRPAETAAAILIPRARVEPGVAVLASARPFSSSVASAAPSSSTSASSQRRRTVTLGSNNAMTPVAATSSLPRANPANPDTRLPPSGARPPASQSTKKPSVFDERR